MEPEFNVLNETTNNQSDFSHLPDVFLSIMHKINLVYTNSDYYKTPARIILLMREICNAII